MFSDHNGTINQSNLFLKKNLQIIGNVILLNNPWVKKENDRELENISNKIIKNITSKFVGCN